MTRGAIAKLADRLIGKSLVASKASRDGSCLSGAEGNTMTFPQIVGRLMQEGFDGYAIDYRRATAIYYLPDGDSVELSTHRIGAPVAAASISAALPTRTSSNSPIDLPEPKFDRVGKGR